MNITESSETHEGLSHRKLIYISSKISRKSGKAATREEWEDLYHQKHRKWWMLNYKHQGHPQLPCWGENSESLHALNLVWTFVLFYAVLQPIMKNQPDDVLPSISGNTILLLILDNN